MAVAVDPDNGQPLGLVTIKDLVEPITGELAAW
jgi:CBS domain containing-hemolysin-like protein